MANLRTKTARWYEVTAVVDRVQDDGQEKRVKEVYVADAMSCTEAEARVNDEIGAYTPEAIKVQLLPAGEFVFEDASIVNNLWYKVKVQFITIDEKTDKEKKTSQYMYVQAQNLAAAREHVDSVFECSAIDYNVAAISETNVLEVYEYNKEDK